MHQLTARPTPLRRKTFIVPPQLSILSTQSLIFHLELQDLLNASKVNALVLT